MGKIKVTECGGIKGLKVVEPTVFGDARGYFMETYNYNDFKEAGIDVEFVQDNQSSSHKGVLRGLHFQINYPQDKLVRVVNGEKHMENGLESYFLLKTRNSSSFRKDLHMVFLCFPSMRNLFTSALISIIQMMRVA